MTQILLHNGWNETRKKLKCGDTVKICQWSIKVDRFRAIQVESLVRKHFICLVCVNRISTLYHGKLMWIPYIPTKTVFHNQIYSSSHEHLLFRI